MFQESSMDFLNCSLRELLQHREIFAVFDEEFQKTSWLDVTALLRSDGTFAGLYEDGTVPRDVLDAIAVRLEDMLL